MPIDLGCKLNREELRTIPLFADLNDEELSQVAALMHFQTYPAGTPVLTARQKGSVVYFIRQGTIKITSEGWCGSEVIIAIVGTGEVLGEIQAVDGLGHSANAVTLEKCSLWWMESADFRKCRSVMPTLTDNLLCLLAKRARFATGRLHVLTSKSMSGRLASQILSLAVTYGYLTSNDQIVIPLRLTQRDMACLIGASRQHTNGIFQSFKDRGLISVNGKRQIIVLDRAALENCE